MERNVFRIWFAGSAVPCQDERLLALDAAISGLSKPCAGFYAAVGSASAVVREGSLMTD